MSDVDEPDMSRFPLGTVEQNGEDYELVFEREYPFPIETIWAAITDPAMTRLWWAESEIDLADGGRFNLRWLNGEDGGALPWSAGEIVALRAGEHIELTNSDHGILQFTLQANGRGTDLTFANMASPPEQRFVTMSLAGWHVHLDHLQHVLEGGVIDWENWYADYGPAWAELHSIYQDVTGLE